MAMLKKISRLFTIKTRFEAWLVIYAIALGSVERGQHYLHPTLVGADGCSQRLHRRCLHRGREASRFGEAGEAGGCCRSLSPRPLGALRSMVVIDPRACRPVMFQGHRFHLAEIDVAPGDRTLAGNRSPGCRTRNPDPCNRSVPSPRAQARCRAASNPGFRRAGSKGWKAMRRCH